MAVEAEDLAARLKAELPHALSTGQLVAYYQPDDFLPHRSPSSSG